MKADFMNNALELAKKAAALGEVPIGAVVVKNGEIIGEGYNLRETNGSILAHAEIMALESAAKKLGDWRLDGCELYVTLEPCLMCSGAIIQTRIKKVVYGALDPKGGAIESVLKVNEVKVINHRFESISKVLEKECSMILKSYFKSKRN